MEATQLAQLEAVSRRDPDLIDRTSRDIVILEALEKVRAMRSWAYSRDESKVEWSAEEEEAYDAAMRAQEVLVTDTSATTIPGVVAQLLLGAQCMEESGWVDLLFCERPFPALYVERDGMDGRTQIVLEAIRELIDIEWKQALGAYLCNERDRDLVLRLKGVIEKERFRLPKEVALSEALTQAMAIVQEAEDRFCNESAIERMFRTLAPDFGAYRRKAQIAIDEQYTDEAAPWLLRDVNFLMGAIRTDQPEATGEPA